MDESSVSSRAELRKTYRYNNRGNLIILSEFVKRVADGSFNLETTTYFEDYDQQKHVENLLTTFPPLPRVTFRINKYHTKIVRYKDGREISRETFAYAYNQEGYPIQKIRSGSGGTIT